MNSRPWAPMLLPLTVIAVFPFLLAQNRDAQVAPKSAISNQPFDPHDFRGDWIGDDKIPGTNTSLGGTGRPRPAESEPPLTDWAKQHLLMKSISHDALAGTLLPGKNPDCPTRGGQGACFATDLNGVPANDPDGEYPGKDCEPLAAPAMYDYPRFGLLTFFVTPQRIVMLNGYHHEWRTFWINREHPKDMDPTFQGDSVARWEGNTLVVDTIGFNGRTPINQSVGHWKSDAFHLVERFTRIDHDHLVIDMTFYDSKAWGDKPWPGHRRYYRLVAEDQVFENNYKSDPFSEWICSPADNRKFDQSYQSR